MDQRKKLKLGTGKYLQVLQVYLRLVDILIICHKRVLTSLTALSTTSASTIVLCRPLGGFRSLHFGIIPPLLSTRTDGGCERHRHCLGERDQLLHQERRFALGHGAQRSRAAGECTGAGSGTRRVVEIRWGRHRQLRQWKRWHGQRSDSLHRPPRPSK